MTANLKNRMKCEAINIASSKQFTITRLILTLSSCLLMACSPENNQSVLGNSLDDPFSFNTAIAYIKRPLPLVDETIESLENPVQIRPGAHLFIRSSASASAEEINITASAWPAGAMYDVRDLNVSPDGEKLVFSMHAPEADIDEPENTWDIWEYDISTDTLSRVITNVFTAEEGNDIQPAYLVSGEIVFSSSRQDTNREILLNEGKSEYSGQQEDAARNANEASHAMVLHTIDPELGDSSLKQITFNQSHDLAPVPLPDGHILYQRWDNIGNNDVVSLYKMNPDGGQLELRYGYHSTENLTGSGSNHLSSMQTSPNGRVVAIAATTPSSLEILGGDIIEIDIDNYIDINTPTFANTGLSGPATESLSPAGSNRVEVLNPISPAGRYAAVWPVNDNTNRLLVSWSDCYVIDPSDSLTKPCSLVPSATAADAAPPLFGLWMYDPSNNSQLPIVQGQEGYMISEVVALEERDIATPVAETIDSSLAADQQAILDIRSIYDLDGVDIAPGGIASYADPNQQNPNEIDAKFLRLVKAVSIPDEDVLDFDNYIFGVSSNQLLREIIGYVPIEPDGSVRAIVPANVPLMFDIVNGDGKRINIENPNTSLRHENWLHLAPGATLSCRGCHANNSTTPHGRIDAQAPSVYSGGSATQPFANAEPALFAPNGGETMAQVYSFHNGIAGRTPSVDLVYIDDWTDESPPLNLTKAPAFSISYENLNTTAPTSTGATGCTTNWDETCRITINYPDHIQPIWELTRTPVDDGTGTLVDSCIGCHTSNSNAQLAAGQLELTRNASDIDADQMTSYRELLRADGERIDEGGTIGERIWECNQLDGNGDPVPDGVGGFVRVNVAASDVFPGLAQVPPSMSEAGSNFGASNFFFNCMTEDNLANEPNDQICRSFTGQAIPAEFVALPRECIELGAGNSNEAVINHNGMLTPEELKLIAEWLDIGAQYYNNPFAAP